MIFSSEIYKKNKSFFKVTIKEHPAKRGYVKRFVDNTILLSDLEPEYLIESNDFIFAPYSSAVAVSLYFSNKQYYLCNDKSTLNLSVFRGFDNINMICSSEELDKVFEFDTFKASGKVNQDLFYTEQSLESWMKILKKEVN